MIWLCIYVSVSVTNALRYYLYLGPILVEAFVSLGVLILHLTQLVVTAVIPSSLMTGGGGGPAGLALGRLHQAAAVAPPGRVLAEPGGGPTRGGEEPRAPGCRGQVPSCQPRGNPGHGRDERGRCRRGRWGTVTLNRGARSLALEPLAARALGWGWAPHRRPRFLPS